MRTIRLHGYGEPLEVLHLEEAESPNPGPGLIRVTVRACGLNSTDWALCRGLFVGKLPRGIGLEISGVVDAVGEGVTDDGTTYPRSGENGRVIAMPASCYVYDRNHEEQGIDDQSGRASDVGYPRKRNGRRSDEWSENGDRRIGNG